MRRRPLAGIVDNNGSLRLRVRNEWNMMQYKNRVRAGQVVAGAVGRRTGVGDRNSVTRAVTTYSPQANRRLGMYISTQIVAHLELLRLILAVEYPETR